MKTILILILLLHSAFSFSQVKNETAFFKLNNDTIIFYLDDVGDVTTNTKASFYKKISIDTLTDAFSGKVEDYYIDGQLAYECNSSNDKLNGDVNCYYKNGQLNYHGYFKESLRDSVWTFYYENGNIEKVVHYWQDIPSVKEFYKSSGEVVFNNGNGNYHGTILGSYKQTMEYRISGKIKNGMMEGRWSWKCPQCSGTDNFKNGEYLSSDHFDNPIPVPRIVSLTGFNIHENVDLFKFIAIPRENKKSTGNVTVKGVPVVFKSSDIEGQVSFSSDDPNNQPLKYMKTINLNTIFSTQLRSYLVNLCKTNQIQFFWSFIQFTINENGNVENVLVKSNNNFISNGTNQFLKNITGFEAVKSQNGVEACDVYLSVIYDKGNLIIPEYNYNNQMLNLWNLLPE